MVTVSKANHYPKSAGMSAGERCQELDVAQTWDSGHRFKTRSGIRVRSKIEKIIADYFSDHGIRFVYEPVVTLGGFRLRPDFYLPDYDLIYEHFGVEDDRYQRGAAAKVARYRQFKVRFLYTTADDEPDIEDALTRKLAEVSEHRGGSRQPRASYSGRFPGRGNPP